MQTVMRGLRSMLRSKQVTLVFNETYHPTERRRPRRAPALWRGFELAQSRQWSRAERAATSLLKQDADHLGALEVLCQAQLHQNRPEEALLTLRRMVRLNPGESGYDVLRASALQSMGRLPEALEALSRARDRAKTPNQKLKIEAEIQMVLECIGVDPSLESAAPITSTRRMTHRAGGVMMIS